MTHPFRQRRLTTAIVVTLLALVGVACGSDAQPETGSPTPTESTPTIEASQDTLIVDESSVSEQEADSLGDRTVALPPAPVGIPGPRDRVVPTSITIDSLRISEANILAAGVELNGDMEVPEADEVGWYEYGPTPGEAGAAVLAAHIAYDGEDGVFLKLDKLAVGENVSISYSDGSSKQFVVTETQQYPKNELPAERVFARTGDASLVLITCGGDFNRSVRSYTDNVVVYAEPL